ncbi:hypothetical protein [Campylobacter ureolyticus]|uniref:Uncharacterized protein n=1 Tax=Campylobacter ureolyticus TaxID=827 RepID=A0A9Q4KJD5_9BACT|nr:hypothetical protein [Campylobacter ureolyticus]MCZ6159030.1 hypothetical protein [Campylobacter ureolyticus]MCZ6162887.1 hypothetical protein [Campylobacter ureolyticus]MCZ6164620.1 hypothetical protein [Campylobacter ureolyticus]
MAILKRLDYIIKKTSSGEIQTQINKIVANLNQKQEVEANKSGSGYKISYYASVFDPRDNREYLAYSDNIKNTLDLGANSTDLSVAIDKEALKTEIIKQISNSINGAVIDDSQKSTSTVYSSSKTEEEISKKVDKTELNNYALKTDIPKKDELVTKDELISDGVTLEFLLSL